MKKISECYDKTAKYKKYTFGVIRVNNNNCVALGLKKGFLDYEAELKTIYYISNSHTSINKDLNPNLQIWERIK